MLVSLYLSPFFFFHYSPNVPPPLIFFFLCLLTISASLLKYSTLLISTPFHNIFVCIPIFIIFIHTALSTNCRGDIAVKNMPVGLFLPPLFVSFSLFSPHLSPSFSSSPVLLVPLLSPSPSHPLSALSLHLSVSVSLSSGVSSMELRELPLSSDTTASSVAQ